MAGGNEEQRGINKLTAMGVRAFVTAAAKGKPHKRKLADGAGLHIALTQSGTPVWRVRYRHGDKIREGVVKGKMDKLYSIGPVSSVTLQQARHERDEVLAALRQGKDPTTERKLARATVAASFGTTFEDVALAWLDHRRSDWSEVHFATTKQALVRDVFKSLGRLPVADITAAMVTRVIDRITHRGAHETAGKVRQNIERIFDFAQARGLCQHNPAEPVLAVLKSPGPSRPHPALLEFPALGDVLRRSNLLSLSPAVRLALRLAAFSACRIGNVIAARWEHFDLDGPTPMWIIPRPEMKMKGRLFPHKVILGPTITAELRTWRGHSGRRTGPLFAAPLRRDGKVTGKTITHESMEKVYRVSLGLRDKHTVHGWRSAFSTLARERGGFSHEVVELTLDHEPRSEVARAYDRGERLEERIRLAYWWDAQLTAAECGGEPLPIRKDGAA